MQGVVRPETVIGGRDAQIKILSNPAFAKCTNGFVIASGKSSMEFKVAMAIREDNQEKMIGKPKSADPRLV